MGRFIPLHWDSRQEGVKGKVGTNCQILNQKALFELETSINLDSLLGPSGGHRGTDNEPKMGLRDDILW